MTKVKNYCPVTVCNFNIAFRFPARPGHGRRVKLPPATAALSNTHQGSLSLGWLCCTPRTQSSIQENTWPFLWWCGACWAPPGWGWVPGSSSDTPEQPPLWLKPHTRAPWRLLLPCSSQADCTGGAGEGESSSWASGMGKCLQNSYSTGRRRGAPPVNSPMWMSSTPWPSARAKQPKTTQDRM